MAFERINHSPPRERALAQPLREPAPAVPAEPARLCGPAWAQPAFWPPRAPESAVATAMAHWLAVEMKMVEMMTPGAVQRASSPAPAPAS